MVRSEGDPLRRAIVCPPEREYYEATELEAHNLEQRSDPEAARHQHGELVATLRARGVEVAEVKEMSGHPNSTFARDPALCTPEGYVELRMGLPSRRGEERWLAWALDGLGEPRLGQIEAPGTVEGGDVLLAGAVALVGLSGRTNEEGIRQLAALLRLAGVQVRVADVRDRYLHLGGALSLVGPGRVVCAGGVFPPSLLEGFDVIEVPHGEFDPSVANVICVGPDEVIGDAAGSEATLEALESRGVTVHGLDLTEFRKGAGGPSCLVLPVERG